MPKLRDLITGSAPTAGGTVKLRDLTASPDRADDQPFVFGPTTWSGYTPEYEAASGVNGFGAGFKPAMADMFGSDEDVANALARQVPGAKFERGADGNAMLRLPNGKAFALDKSGVQANEVMATGGRMLALSPVGRTVTSLPTLGARIIGGGAAAMGSDAGMQALAGREEIDPAQTMIAGMFGAGGELLAPIVGKGLNWARDQMRSPAKVLQQGRALAQQAGMESVDDATAAELGKRYFQSTAGADPKKLAAESEFGYRFTKGEKTGDFRQLAHEERIGAQQGAAGDILRGAKDRNQSQIGENIQSILAKLTGGKVPQDAASAMQTVLTAAKGQRDALKGQVDAAYGEMRGKNATIAPGFVNQLHDRLKASFQGTVLDEKLTPAGLRAIQTTKEFAEDKLSFETARQRLNSLVKTAANPGDKRAVVMVKNEMDAWLDDAVEKAVVSGDEGAVEALKKARGLRAELGRRFEARPQPGEPDLAGKIVQRLVRSNATPEEMGQAVFGASALAKPAAVQTVRRLKEALGDNQEGWNALRANVVLRMTRGKDGETLGAQAVANNIRAFLRERPALVKEMFSPKETSLIGRFANATAELAPKGMMGRSSGTAERALRFMSDVSGTIPGLRTVMGALKGPADVARAYGAHGAPAQRYSLLPASAGAGPMSDRNKPPPRY